MKTSLSLSALQTAVKLIGQVAFKRALIVRGLITTLMVFSLGGTGRADEEGWHFLRNESSFSVGLDAPGGTSGILIGAQRQVTATVYRYAWEIWESDSGSGSTEIREYSGGACANAAVSFSTDGGDLSVSSGSTNSSGTASTSFTMGIAEPATVTVVATDPLGSATSSASIVFTPPEPETWSFSHNESLLYASVTDGWAGGEVPIGETRSVQVQAQYDSWEVWISNYGTLQTRNPSSSPAAGAALAWSVEGEGGTVISGGSGQVNEQGYAWATFTMGSLTSVVRADLSYAGSTNGAASASLTVNPAPVVEPVEQWQYDHTEGYISASLSANGGLSDVPVGTQRQVTVNVQYTSWEIWTSNLGNTDIKPQTTGPAIGAPVSFTTSADGSYADSGSSTDSSGNASTTFTMGSQASSVMVAATYADGSASASLGFTPAPPPPTDPPPNDPPPNDPPPTETWSYHHTTESISVSASGSGASVSFATVEVWLSNLGNYKNENPASGTAINAPVSCSVTSGDAVVKSCDSSTDGAGMAYFSVAGGSQTSTVQISASFVGLSGSATITVGIADSDGDGFSDAEESSSGSNPNDANSTPAVSRTVETIIRIDYTDPSDPGTYIWGSVEFTNAQEILLGIAGTLYQRIRVSYETHVKQVRRDIRIDEYDSQDKLIRSRTETRVVGTVEGTRYPFSTVILEEELVPLGGTVVKDIFKTLQ